ncbi:MAG: AfsR/SARP family transcriptional regulator, partial [Micromonosporaceae bacterium]
MRLTVAAGGVEIRLLGPFEVVSDRPVTVPRGRVRSLLATLALAGHRPVPVEALVDHLWGGSAPANARQALQNNVWRLRHLLGDAAVVNTADGYQLDVPEERVDVRRFLGLLERVDASPGEVRERLTAALRLWRGEPLSGVDSEVLRDTWVPLLTERYLTAVERQVDLDMDSGQLTGLVADLRGLLAKYPLRESLWVRLLTALAESGRTAEALDAYERARRLLADQLGTDPSAELRELHRRILLGHPGRTAPGTSPPGTSPPGTTVASPPAGSAA